MHTITVPGVNDAWERGLNLIRSFGVYEKSRAGDVLRVPDPVTTTYTNHIERVLTDPVRDANPFFHLMEALWILAGRNDVEFLTRFNSRMVDFSDDGKTFHAAYGYRLRHHFGFDQIKAALNMRYLDRRSRRIVLSIWDPKADLGVESKDIPCNDTIKLEINNEALDMIVFNRSNDMIWGAYGANAVQFSILAEYIAGMLSRPLGRYTQISSNFHVYDAVWQKYAVHAPEPSLYRFNKVTVLVPLVGDATTFDRELHTFFRLADVYEKDGDEVSFYDTCMYNNDFFVHVATPMYVASRMWRAGRTGEARDMMQAVVADDWRLAGLAWMERRLNK